MERNRDRLDLRRPRNVQKCRVRVAEGSVPVSPLDIRAFDEGDLENGWRLACRAEAQHDLVVDVPPLVTRPKAATVGVGRQVILHPAVQKRYVELEEPTLRDQRTDVERLLDAVDDLELRVETGVLRRLPKVLRESAFRVTCVIVDDLLIDVEPGDTSEKLHGTAFDLGTTTVVATSSTSARGRRSRCGRCSTSNSRSAPT